MEEGGGSRRLEVMQRVERTIDEELDYMEEIFEARDEVLEERRLLGAGHIEEDEDSSSPKGSTYSKGKGVKQEKDDK